MKPTYEELVEALKTVINDFESEGCDGCGTISFQSYNLVGTLLDRAGASGGFVPLNVDDYDDLDDVDDGDEDDKDDDGDYSDDDNKDDD